MHPLLNTRPWVLSVNAQLGLWKVAHLAGLQRVKILHQQSHSGRISELWSPLQWNSGLIYEFKPSAVRWVWGLAAIIESHIQAHVLNIHSVTQHAAAPPHPRRGNRALFLHGRVSNEWDRGGFYRVTGVWRLQPVEGGLNLLLCRFLSPTTSSSAVSLVSRSHHEVPHWTHAALKQSRLCEGANRCKSSL